MHLHSRPLEPKFRPLETRMRTLMWRSCAHRHAQRRLIPGPPLHQNRPTPFTEDLVSHLHLPASPACTVWLRALARAEGCCTSRARRSRAPTPHLAWRCPCTLFSWCASRAPAQAAYAKPVGELCPASLQPRGTKTLHLVRHGESTYNAACGAPGSSWEDPDIFDAQLTDRGRDQACCQLSVARTEPAAWLDALLCTQSPTD